MKEVMEKLERRIPTVDKAVKEAEAELSKQTETEKNQDVALNGFLKKFQFRQQLFLKWCNHPGIAKVYNLYKPEQKHKLHFFQPPF